jgi:hypothetical protein
MSTSNATSTTATTTSKDVASPGHHERGGTADQGAPGAIHSRLLIGRAKLKNVKATEAERFFTELGKTLSKRSPLMIRSTLRRSIRRAQRHDLIARNVAELADLPEGQARSTRRTGAHSGAPTW